MLSRRRMARGQSTAEYILIVVLVAVLSIGVITVYGNQIRDLFGLATKRLGGIEDATLNSRITDEADQHVDEGLPDLRGTS